MQKIEFAQVLFSYAIDLHELAQINYFGTYAIDATVTSIISFLCKFLLQRNILLHALLRKKNRTFSVVVYGTLKIATNKDLAQLLRGSRTP